MENLKVFINGLTGDSPYHVYICQSSINECYYIDTISGTTYNFDIPKPFDNNTSYFLKVIDGNQNTIIGSMGITPTPTRTTTITPTTSITPTFTPTASITPTMSITPTITPTMSITPTITPTMSITPTITPTPTLTPTTPPTCDLIIIDI